MITLESFRFNVGLGGDGSPVYICLFKKQDAQDIRIESGAPETIETIREPLFFTMNRLNEYLIYIYLYIRL